MNLKTRHNTLLKLESDAQHLREEISEELVNTVITPFCLKYGMTMISGMGGFYFIMKGNKHLLDLEEREDLLKSTYSTILGLTNSEALEFKKDEEFLNSEFDFLRNLYTPTGIKDYDEMWDNIEAVEDVVELKGYRYDLSMMDVIVNE